MATSLSAVLPSTCRSARRLVLSSRGIGVIDTIPTPFLALEFLDLSRNAIRSLFGLRTLTRLRVLLLSHNCVESLAEVKHLAQLQDLEEADFTGNPVTTFISFRDECILTCGSLALLDRVGVTEEEVQGAQQRSIQRENLIVLIVANEETIAKLEQLQRRLKIHAEMIVENVLVEYSPVDIDKLLTNFSLDWPESVILDYRESLELKVNERLSETNDEWKPLYLECLDRQKEFISSLKNACQSLVEEAMNLWEGRATHARDWSLGPRRSTADLGLGTLGQELDSVLSEHRHLQETTVLQQRQLAAILARNEELEECLCYFKSRSGDTATLHSAIGAGISAIVERFRDQHRLKRVFDKLILAVFVLRRRKMFTETVLERLKNDIGTLCFSAWKWATKVGKFLVFRETERNEGTLRKAFRGWRTAAKLSIAAGEFLMQRKLRLLQRIVQAWSVYPLLGRDFRLKMDSAALQYSRVLVLRILHEWHRAAHQSPKIRHWRDIHCEKLQTRSLSALRAATLLARSQHRKSLQGARRNLMKKAFFALRSFMFLTAKKRQLLARIHAFVTFRALKRLRQFQLQQRRAMRVQIRAEQFHSRVQTATGFKAIMLWCELSKERTKRLVRLIFRRSKYDLRTSLLRWRAEAVVPDFMNHTMSVVICKRGYLLGRKVLKLWRRLNKQQRKLQSGARVWHSRARLKSLSRSVTIWLGLTLARVKGRLSDVRCETQRLEHSLTSRESELKSLQSSNQKLRFQLEEQTQLQESPETKRTLEELTSRGDLRRVQLLESELASAKNELSVLRTQKSERTPLEGLRRELASARALCTSLTSELQKTTAALQSQQAEFHLQVNELTEQLTEARCHLQKTTKENREMKEKLRNRDDFYLDLSRTQESARAPELTVSPRLTLDCEERRVRQQLESLKRERTAIRGEIENRLRDLEESRSAMSTPGPTLSSLGELSVRLSQLESRMTSSRH